MNKAIPTSLSDVWVEKYRPKALEDVEGSPDVLHRLKAMAATGDMQHLMLTGPPGTGKTTSVHCLANALLGAATPECILELNASDDNGVEVVRGIIKNFARQERSGLRKDRHKIVILDEADSMTQQAQQALRRTMEVYSNTTRFVLICNSSTKIIEPIQSRCSIIRFGRLTEEKVLTRLVRICEAENVRYTEDGLGLLVQSCAGDLRLAINNMQSCVVGFTDVTKENVLKVCDMPAPDKVRAVLEHCLSGNWIRSRPIVQEMVAEGYIYGDICAVVKMILRRDPAKNGVKPQLSEDQVLACLEAVIMTSSGIAKGLGSALQMDALLRRLQEIGQVR